MANQPDTKGQAMATIIEIRPINKDEKTFLEMWSSVKENTLATVLDNGVSQVVIKWQDRDVAFPASQMPKYEVFEFDKDGSVTTYGTNHLPKH
jgi:hypothetical protein